MENFKKGRTHDRKWLSLVTYVGFEVGFSGLNTGFDAFKTVTSLCHVSLQFH